MKQEFEAGRIVIDTKYFTLRQYSDGLGTPVFVAPPFAGRGGEVALNLIKKCVAAGRRVYAYDLKSADQGNKDLTIEGLIGIFLQCHKAIGADKFNLLGCCQGGWLSAMFAALYPEKVNRLAVFAAPINLHTGCGNKIEEYCKSISMAWHRWVMNINGGIQPGLMQWLSFATANPWPVYVDRYVNLYWHYMRDDQPAISKWQRNEGWHDRTKCLGAWFESALEDHFVNNRLYNGTWRVGGRLVDLSQITCPVFVYAGADDKITSIEQAIGILDKVSSAEKRFMVFPGAGHTKVFTGVMELEQFAGQFFAEVDEYERLIQMNEGRN